jgi:tRNA(fMet)-specific endonuclease VapC
MIVLDTDVLAILQQGNGQLFEQLVSQLTEFDEQDVAVTIISFEEQMRGWLAYIAQARSDQRQLNGYSRLHALLDDFQSRPVLEYSPRAIEEFRRLRSLKIRIGTMDLKIAAIALANDAIVITRNLVDFQRVPGLTVKDWTEPTR